MMLLERLDAYGTDEPGFREGHPEDRCPVCDQPVGDHKFGVPVLGSFPRTRAVGRAKWAHRRAAAFALFCFSFTTSA